MSNRQRFLQKNASLNSREFRLYLIVRFGLIFALSMQFTIITYWIYQITNHSKMALAMVGLAEVIPVVATSFFSGYFVDLREKRNMWAKIVLAYIALGLFLLYLSIDYSAAHLSHSLRIAGIYVAIFLGGIVRAFLGPTSFSMLGLVLPRNLYANGSSWSSMAWQLGSVFGPLVSGAVIALLHPAAGMAIVVMVEVLMLPAILAIAPKPIIKKEKEPVMKSIGEGLKFVFKTPSLLGAQLLDMFSVLFGGAIALLPAVQQEFFPADGSFFSGVNAFGFLRAAPGIGALITLALLAFIPLRMNPGKKLFACVAGFGLSIIVFGLSRHFFLSFFVLVCSGMFDGVSVVIRSTILQLVTPDHMRGRVASVNSMFISSSNELGDFESGVMASWLGTVPAIVTGGFLTLAIVVFTFFKTPELRNFKFEDHDG